MTGVQASQYWTDRGDLNWVRKLDGVVRKAPSPTTFRALRKNNEVFELIKPVKAPNITTKNAKERESFAAFHSNFFGQYSNLKTAEEKIEFCGKQEQFIYVDETCLALPSRVSSVSKCCPTLRTKTTRCWTRRNRRFGPQPRWNAR